MTGHWKGVNSRRIVVSILMLAFLVQVGLAARVLQGSRDGPTDLAPDIFGAIAVARGETPYQQVFRIDETAPESVRSHWVTHSPATLAAVLGMLGLVGERESVDDVALMLGVIVWGVVMIAAIRRKDEFSILACLGAVATVSFAHTVYSIQNGVAFAAGMTMVLVLDRVGPRLLALILLGVLVALKPWLAPVAACLPGSRSAFRDLLTVALTACVTTLSVLPALGGAGVLGDWLTNALPANVMEFRTWRNTLSLTGALSSTGAAAVLALAMGAVMPAARRLLPRCSWPMLGWYGAIVLPPLAWPDYLVDLAPLLIYAVVYCPTPLRRAPLAIAAITILPSFVLPIWSEGYIYTSFWARGLMSLVLAIYLIAGVGERWFIGGPLTDNRFAQLLGVQSAGLFVGTRTHVPPPPELHSRRSLVQAESSVIGHNPHPGGPGAQPQEPDSRAAP